MLVAGGCAPPPSGTAIEMASRAPSRIIDVRVTEAGFEPPRIAAAHGEVVTLRFTRLVDHTCVKRVVVYLDGEHRIERDLPKQVPIDVTMRLDRPGELGFSCTMAMRGGAIDIR